MGEEKDGNPEELPLVVQLGFAGSRRLLDEKKYPGIKLKEFEAEIVTLLAARIEKLKTDLGMDVRHFFCGISALAIGGDTVFCRACSARGIPLRIFLPQTRDEFFNAKGSEEPDFSEEQKEEATAFLDSDQVIQERLVSDASNRSERFEDTNREIVRVSNVLICLKRKEAEQRKGGTEDLIDRAVLRDKPVLVIEVDAADGKAIFDEQWRLPARDGKVAATPREAFERPELPRTLRGLRFGDWVPGHPPPIAPYADAIKDLSSRKAGMMRDLFQFITATIIGTHIIATILATISLGFGNMHITALLLKLELTMLAVGLFVHHILHLTGILHSWAEARLLAEVSRSVRAIGSLHVYLSHLFSLPFPGAIKPLLRTINVLQLKTTRHDHGDWREKRDKYVERRLSLPEKGQIAFYGRRAGETKRYRRRLHQGFHFFWTAAFISTATEFALHSYAHAPIGHEEFLRALMGFLAIVMPVLAAGMLSLAGALDLEAEEHTYHELHEFLCRQKDYLNSAGSERDFARLVIETETQLLGETANWFSRRSFTGVS